MPPAGQTPGFAEGNRIAEGLVEAARWPESAGTAGEGKLSGTLPKIDYKGRGEAARGSLFKVPGVQKITVSIAGGKGCPDIYRRERRQW